MYVYLRMGEVLSIKEEKEKEQGWNGSREQRSRRKPAQQQSQSGLLPHPGAPGAPGARRPFMHRNLWSWAPEGGLSGFPRPRRPCPCRVGVESQKPAPLAGSFPLLPGAVLWRHMETVSIYPAPSGCGCTLCASERKPWIPRRVISEAACKAASCFAGSVWALLHQWRKRYHLCKQVILVWRPVL